MYVKISTVAFFLAIVFTSTVVMAGKIHIIRLKSGGVIKCRSIKRTGNVILCDADGLMMTIATSTIKQMIQATGQLTKRSPQVGPRVGQASRPYISSKAGALSKYNKQKSSIRVRCQNKWLQDYEMVEYCIKKQSKAKRNIDRMR